MTIRPNEERAKKAISLMKATVIGTSVMSLIHVYTIYFYSSDSFIISMDQLMTYGLIVGVVGFLFLVVVREIMIRSIVCYHYNQ